VFTQSLSFAVGEIEPLRRLVSIVYGLVGSFSVWWDHESFSEALPPYLPAQKEEAFFLQLVPDFVGPRSGGLGLFSVHPVDGYDKHAVQRRKSILGREQSPHYVAPVSSNAEELRVVIPNIYMPNNDIKIYL